jgi:hypothetical protein
MPVASRRTCAAVLVTGYLWLMITATVIVVKVGVDLLASFRNGGSPPVFHQSALLYFSAALGVGILMVVLGLWGRRRERQDSAQVQRNSSYADAHHSR